MGTVRTAFFYDLTGHVQFGSGSTNVIAVRADNGQQPASRWYAGAGIYRSVRLVTTSDVHIAPWGTFVTTPQVSAAEATIHVRATAMNDSAVPARVRLALDILAPGVAIGGTRAREPNLLLTVIPPHGTADLEVERTIPRPERWDTDRPVLYAARAALIGEDTSHPSSQLDAEDVPFGIGEFHFDPGTGFWLNGRNFKIKGAALHGDMGRWALLCQPPLTRGGWRSCGPLASTR